MARFNAMAGMAAMLACSLIAAMGQARAADCTVEGGRDGVIEALNKAPSCKASYAILEACSWGSSQDVEFASIVVPKCEREFPASMSAKAKVAYARGKEKCATKYAKQQGTMYISFSALCAAKLAKDYASAKK